MSQPDKSFVMDVLPWPDGHGFSGTGAWWEYVLSKDEQRRLDHLLGLALLDDDIQNRLVHERDDSLMATFGLSDETRAWLHSLAATTLTELAQAIVSERHTETLLPCLETSSEAA